MASDTLNKSAEPTPNVGPIQTESIAFETGEMVPCSACARANPPNRFKCLYCGHELDIGASGAGLIKPALRKLEGWEKGFNLIWRPEAKLEESTVAGIANLLGREVENVRSITAAVSPLPLARVESNHEAEFLSKRLEEIGVKSLIVSDEQLDPTGLPTRVRGLRIDADKLILTAFNTGESISIERDDLAVIVSGAVFEQKTESIKKLKRGGKGKVLDETPTFNHEILIDIYQRKSPLGFRILPYGFDFSGLGAEKKMLAVENMQILLNTLQHFATGARIVTNYGIIKEGLGQVWEIEERNQPQGMRRQGFGKFGIGNITVSSNLDQFTRYSRLQWHLL